MVEKQHLFFLFSDKTFESDLSSELSFCCAIPCFKVLVEHLESQSCVKVSAKEDLMCEEPGN